MCGHVGSPHAQFMPLTGLGLEYAHIRHVVPVPGIGNRLGRALITCRHICWKLVQGQNLPLVAAVGKTLALIECSAPSGAKGRSGRKPSSVRPPEGGRAAICLGRPSPGVSSGLPAARAVRVAPRRLFGLAPIGGYRATAVTSGAVGSYPTFSPLPAETGGIFSVALSVASRRPGVTWQSTLWSSDFPRGPMGPAITAPNLFAIER